MFLPIGDTPNPRITPYVNYALIAANVGVFLLISLPLMYSQPDLDDPLLLEYLYAFGVRGGVAARDVLAQVSAYDLFVFRWGYRPAEGSVATLFAAMFLHGGWMHLIGNMLFLWIFGDNVEARLGRVRYLLVYLGTGIAATLFFALFVPDSQVPLVGASGAISGVLGCYFLWFPRNQVKTFIFLFPFIMTTFLIPARFVLGFYLVIDNVLPFIVTRGGGSGVAHGAHIGGFLAGLAVAFAAERLPRLFTVADESPREDLAPFEKVLRSLRGGNIGQAALRYLSLSELQRRQLPAGAVLAIADWLLERHDHRTALSIYRQFIAERPNDDALDRAYLGAGRALLRPPRNFPGARQYFLAALDVTASAEVEAVARGHLQQIEAARG